MKTIQEVIRKWEENAHVNHAVRKVTVNLSLLDVARIRALCELYPGFTEEQFITELISAALDEVEASLPYVKGARIIGEDEFGEPIYEDVGKTPGFEQLTKRHLQALDDELNKN